MIILVRARQNVLTVLFSKASISFVNLFHNGSEEEPISIEGHSGTLLVFRRVEAPSFWFVAVLVPDLSVPILR